MSKLRGKLIGALLFAAVSNISAEGAALNAVCTFHPGKEALRRSDYESWLRSGLVGCRLSREPASVLIIPAPDALDSWSEASVAANLCDFTKSIAIIPARSIHAVSSRNQTHMTEANSVIVCALQTEKVP